MKRLTGHHTLTPAYGRDYSNARDIKQDFMSGRDFIHQPSGQYTSLRDFESPATIELRYLRTRRCLLIKI